MMYSPHANPGHSTCHFIIEGLLPLHHINYTTTTPHQMH